MRKIISIVIIIVFLSGVLYPLEAQEARKPKSEVTAVLLSLGATVIPTRVGLRMRSEFSLYLIGFGVFIGPSTGHFYANQWMRGMATVCQRLFIILGGAALSEDLEFGERVGIALLAGVFIIVSVLYDIGTAPASVRKYNESIGKTGEVYFVPKIDIKEESYGLSLVYCF